MKKKLISFVIPIYNEQESIPHLISSLTGFVKKNKKYRFELVLVENGSQDNSFKLLKKYALKNKIIKV
ncbi:MAG: glycosyltransferase, partial [Candidatus Roizmanbacteria bacterium]|nr:glycosyltransferase [Candidatus Roizmanbacteria bacterium]